MRGSLFLRRIMLLLVSAIVLSAGLTMLFYYYLSTDIIYTNIAQADFRKKGSYLAEQAERWLGGERSQQAWNGMLETAPEMLSATLVLRLGRPVVEADLSAAQTTVFKPELADLDDGAIEAALERLFEFDSQLLNQEAIQLRGQFGEARVDTVMAGYPITRFNRSERTRQVVGAIYILKSMQRIRTGYGTSTTPSSWPLPSPSCSCCCPSTTRLRA